MYHFVIVCCFPSLWTLDCLLHLSTIQSTLLPGIGPSDIDYATCKSVDSYATQNVYFVSYLKIMYNCFFPVCILFTAVFQTYFSGMKIQASFVCVTKNKLKTSKKQPTLAERSLHNQLRHTVNTSLLAVCWRLRPIFYVICGYLYIKLYWLIKVTHANWLTRWFVNFSVQRSFMRKIK